MTETPATEPLISMEELQMAARNHGMPLEALRWQITPIGLHYLLIHYDIPVVDPSSWRLEIGGRVRMALSLALDQVMARPAVTMPVTFECAGNGRALLEPHVVSQPWIAEAVGTGEWTGTPLWPLLDEAGVEDDAVEVLFTGLDRGLEGEVEQDYQRSLPLQECRRRDVLLAYALNGQSLPPQHGFPLRLVVPGWYGMTNVKWLRRITAVAEPFQGYQHTHSYRRRADPDEPGTALSRMEPRALLIPPGIPEFMSRRRIVPAGHVRLEGRAWSGWGPIERVEVSTDGGATWVEAEMGEQPGPSAWRGFSFPWEARPGEFVVCARATDATGRGQPLDSPWNVGGYANNAVQQVAVTVVA